MIGLVVFLVLYVAVPYVAYRAVLQWTGSAAAAWVGALLLIPASAFIYVRVFERLRHGSWRR